MKRLLLFLIFVVSFAKAESIYVAQTAQGSDTGANAANAHSISWANTSSNWDTDVSADGKIGPGDTVHLVGTLTSQLDLQGGGSSGNRITIKFESGAKFSKAFWTSSGCITGTGSTIQFITIEGGNLQAGDNVQTQVDMEATANGTALANQVGGTRFIWIENAGSDITIKNLWMQDLYVRTYMHASDITDTGSAISLRGQNNLVIENCYIRNAETGLTVVGNGASRTGHRVSDCWITDCSNGIKLGIGGSGDTILAAQVLRNRIDHMARWGGIESGGFHNDGIQPIADAGGVVAASFQGLVVAYNHIGPNISTDGSTTSPIFLAAGITGAKVYNNFIEYGSGHFSSNQAINVGNSPVENDNPLGARHLIVNNTIKGAGLAGAINASYAIVQGNVVYNMGSQVTIGNNVDQGASLNFTSNFNIYNGGTEFGVASGPGSGIYASFSDWKTALGHDAASLFTDPLINSNGTLQAGSPAIGLAPTQSEFSDDFNGNPRTGSWDAGAFEFVTGGSGSVTIGTVNVQNLRVAP